MQKRYSNVEGIYPSFQSNSAGRRRNRPWDDIDKTVERRSQEVGVLDLVLGIRQSGMVPAAKDMHEMICKSCEDKIRAHIAPTSVDSSSALKTRHVFYVKDILLTIPMRVLVKNYWVHAEYGAHLPQAIFGMYARWRHIPHLAHTMFSNTRYDVLRTERTRGQPMSDADRLFAKSVKDRALTLRQFIAIQVCKHNSIKSFSHIRYIHILLFRILCRAPWELN